MDLNQKKIPDNRGKSSFKKKNFNSVFAPKEILVNPNRPSWLLLPPKSIDLVFLDFETTGGNPSNSSIIEIGAIKYSNGKETGRFETLVKPNHHISKIVQKITGISNKMVENSPTFEEIAHSFFEFIGDSPIIAHGALGDIAFVYQHYKEIMNKDFTNYYFCTHLIVNHFLPNIPSKTLSGIAKYFNLPEIPAHKALNDAQLTCDIFWKITQILDRHGYKSCLDFLKIQSDNETLKKLGPGINPNLSENIPMSSGVVFLTNPDQEISFISATQNIRKSYHKLTTISADRELNKIIAHVEGFKFERTANFLEALIKENQQLKKLFLIVDPRKIQNRSESFVQLFIPEDMLQFSSKYSGNNPFLLPSSAEYEFDDIEEDYQPQDRSHAPNDFILDFHNKNEKILINKARKNFSTPQTKKFTLSRNRSESAPVVEFGHLKEGVGYSFGPFEKPKEVSHWINSLLVDFPFYDSNLSMDERFVCLKIIVAYLYNNLTLEKEEIKQLFFQDKSFKNFLLWPLYFSYLNRIKKLMKIENIIGPKQYPKSGLAVITNNELKEFEVVLVVKGVIQKKLRLALEQSDKLRSSRYMTRLFEKEYEKMKSYQSPALFAEDSCSNIELFEYWLENKRGEGEWIDFEDIEPLYDPSIL